MHKLTHKHSLNVVTSLRLWSIDSKFGTHLTYSLLTSKWSFKIEITVSCDVRMASTIPSNVIFSCLCDLNKIKKTIILSLKLIVQCPHSVYRVYFWLELFFVAWYAYGIYFFPLFPKPKRLSTFKGSETQTKCSQFYIILLLDYCLWQKYWFLSEKWRNWKDHWLTGLPPYCIWS